jgi:hypothetical protein
VGTRVSKRRKRRGVLAVFYFVANVLQLIKRDGSWFRAFEDYLKS